MRSFVTLTVLAALAVPAMTVRAADDTVARAKYQAALDLYAQRADLSKNLQAQGLVEEGLAAVGDNQLKFQLLILKARTKYWQGMNMPTSPKEPTMAVFEAAYVAAKDAYTTLPTAADGYYFYAISLGRWALIKGKLASLSRKGELMDHLNKAIARTTLAGDAGESIDGYGPDRTYGKMYKELPGFAGGDHTLAVRYTKKCYDNAPELALNSVYYAEALIDGSSTEKQLGCSVLEKLLKFEATPEALNPDRIPETIQELKEGRDLYNDEC